MAFVPKSDEELAQREDLGSRNHHLTLGRAGTQDPLHRTPPVARRGRLPHRTYAPRGDFYGFVKVADDKTRLIPDRRGNNRLDTLRNLVRNPKIGLLFLVPGASETFRVNGEAVVSSDPALTEQFVMQGQAPRTVIVVTVKEAYIQCSRALVRADLWNPEKHPAPGVVPSMGTMLAQHTRGFVDAKAFDEEAKARVPKTLY